MAISSMRPSAEPETVRYRVRHRTHYAYMGDVTLSHHLLHLGPRMHPLQRVHAAEIVVEPAPAVRTAWTDFFGNPATYIEIEQPHRELLIEATVDLTVTGRAGTDPDRTPDWEDVRDTVAGMAGEPARFAFESVLVRGSDDLAAFARPCFPAGRPVAAAATELMARIHESFAFDPVATTVATPLGEVLASRRGVCQDFAHLAVGCLRSLGLPVRYVSGYLRTLPPPGQPRLVGIDASHAWFSVWCGHDAGWLDLDPTNGREAGTDHVTLAWGRDYDDVSPVRGVIVGGGADHSLSVEVDVEPVAGE
ncbi:MAG TPA: transglutaminase family protein [Arenibaculum sp.]|nr:transglutaminase family protein [Arenibaculum sp.]